MTKLFKAADMNKILASLAKLDKVEPLTIAAQIGDVIGERRMARDAAADFVKENFSDPKGAKRSVLIAALTLGDTTAQVAEYYDGRKDDFAASWSAVFSHVVKGMESGLEMSKAFDNAAEKYTGKSDLVTAHNRAVSLTDQLGKALKAMATQHHKAGGLEAMAEIQAAYAAFAELMPKPME